MVFNLRTSSFSSSSSSSSRRSEEPAVVQPDGQLYRPTHLRVMVSGLLGSARDWRYAVKQFVKAHPRKVFVHCSQSNPARLTFDGVDVMGERLAEEVKSVIKHFPTLRKISFICHSLGGLVARYAVAKLYGSGPAVGPIKVKGECGSQEPGNHLLGDENANKICGLKPVNFIASATPHLGSRGHKQVPALFGSNFLENLAVHTAWLIGRTGRHLFLTDDDGKPPLLLQMIEDSEDIKFISALKSFRRRVVYANAQSDHLVGWSTSSLRHQSNLPKHGYLSAIDKRYPHIINVEAAKRTSFEQENSSEYKTDRRNPADLEEVMLGRLTRLSWERVDVRFRGCFAHDTIQVRTPLINSDGKDVIRHMIDNFIVRVSPKSWQIRMVDTILK